MHEATEPGADAGRFHRAVAAIDAANAEDPVRLLVDGVEQPKELVHAAAVERWVRTLDPDATEAQLLAARAHHLRRWVVPRSDYPDGRAAYLRWRADHKERQAAEVAELLAGCGYDGATIEQVATLVAKKGLGRDPQVQTHEDALCLTFLELQLDPVAEQLGPEHAVQVLRRTARKMSAAGLAAAGTIALSATGAALLAEALGGPADDPT